MYFIISDFYAPTVRGAFRFAFVHPSVRPSENKKNCDEGGKMGASMSYGHTSSLFAYLGNGLGLV